jgi:hypothetical protein
VAITIAPAELGLISSAKAQSSKISPVAATIIEPGNGASAAVQVVRKPQSHSRPEIHEDHAQDHD